MCTHRAFGTTVVRHRTIPQRPEGYKGVFNDRPYFARGWTCFESGVSTEAIARAQYYKGLKAVLDRLPPKLIEIDGDGPRVADAGEAGGDDEGAGPRIERVRAALNAATFTGKGDREVVVGLYTEYIRNIGNAMAWSGESVGGVYEGDYNAAGQEEGRGTMRFASGDVYEGEFKAGKMEGRGTYQYADGDVYEGEWKAGKKEGRGTYRYADGGVEVGFYKAGASVGEGVGWSADGQTAMRLRDGEEEEEISLEEARRVVAQHGLPLPATLGLAPRT